MNKKHAAQCFKKMGGREGLAERALEIAREIVESGSYNRAIAGAGQLGDGRFSAQFKAKNHILN
jgi:hypothetical protein